jgi:hypothetical protein
VTLSPARGDVPGLSLCLPTTTFEHLVQQPVIYLMETKWVHPEPIGVRLEGKGKKQVEVIETQTGKLRVDFYLDPKTKLPKKLVTHRFMGLWEEMTPSNLITIELSNYENINGIQMPQRVTRLIDLSMGTRIDTERAHYRFDVPYNSAIFGDPAPKNVKRNDWKLPSTH